MTPVGWGDPDEGSPGNGATVPRRGELAAVVRPMVAIILAHAAMLARQRNSHGG